MIVFSSLHMLDDTSIPKIMWTVEFDSFDPLIMEIESNFYVKWS